MKTFVPIILIVALLLWNPKGGKEVKPGPDRPDPVNPVAGDVWDELADWDIQTTNELAQIVRKLVENEVLTSADLDKFDAAFPDFLSETRDLTDADRDKLRSL